MVIQLFDEAVGSVVLDIVPLCEEEEEEEQHVVGVGVDSVAPSKPPLSPKRRAHLLQLLRPCRVRRRGH